MRCSEPAYALDGRHSGIGRHLKKPGAELGRVAEILSLPLRRVGCEWRRRLRYPQRGVTVWQKNGTGSFKRPNSQPQKIQPPALAWVGSDSRNSEAKKAAWY